jgi:hypothetical protein
LNFIHEKIKSLRCYKKLGASKNMCVFYAPFCACTRERAERDTRRWSEMEGGKENGPETERQLKRKKTERNRIRKEEGQRERRQG